MKITAISGSSAVSSQRISPTAAWCARIAPVLVVTPTRASTIQGSDQLVKP